MKTMDELPDDDMQAKLYNGWLNVRPWATKKIKQMRMKFYEDGGFFDKFAGDDGLMSLEEATALQKASK